MVFENDGYQDDCTDTLKIEVMGESSARNYYPDAPNEVCISITSKNYPSEVKLNQRFSNILRLEFDDTPDEDVEFEGIVDVNETISSSQADRVVKFINANLQSDKIVIHCFAGVSRSRSMAAAIADWLNLPYKFTILNSKVYKAITEAFQRNIL